MVPNEISAAAPAAAVMASVAVSAAMSMMIDCRAETHHGPALNTQHTGTGARLRPSSYLLHLLEGHLVAVEEVHVGVGEDQDEELKQVHSGDNRHLTRGIEERC
jgi:hypothetical protein